MKKNILITGKNSRFLKFFRKDKYKNNFNFYLPNRKRPMLPTILCDAICSLVEGNLRIAFTLDMTINKETYEIINTRLSNTLIKVKHNLRYDTDFMRNNEVYKKIQPIIHVYF